MREVEAVEFEQIRYQVVDRIAFITLNRPERLNAFTPVMRDELLQALEAADWDDEVRVLIVTGEGRAFCAGHDMASGEGTTFADGSMSAYPGTDRHGPYALFTSATCWDHSRSQNSQMNLKIHPTAIHGVAGTRKLLDLTRAYMRKGGFHIQYNVVDSKMLRKAQDTPDRYRDLVVRVAGFTQYWVEIGKPIQDEVIARTEYEGV